MDALSQHVMHRVDGEKLGGPMSAYSTIQFTVQKHHFIRGKIKIRCSANMYSIYFKSTEKTAEEERIRTTPATLPEVNNAVVYSIHRTPPTHASAADKVVSAKLYTIIMFTLFLPTVLR
ncbi:uncharacterized protein LOC115450882 isoform X2 [Manduca sexta]|uniref:Uncharacterized protein n=1 Tax=Manduca sexta TaxID=7130 RepID=A0A921ZPD7_MANSE|nr:uncharacterized protein LOC115450882 isoform X2 [Manduca sexta]KAG6461369.1 hypothetical protein O3G_MSEX012577 [Manduca sexta]